MPFLTKVREGRRAADFPELCVFLNNTAISAIHQIKAEYHGYLSVSMIWYNSSEVQLNITKEIEIDFF